MEEKSNTIGKFFFYNLQGQLSANIPNNYNGFIVPIMLVLDGVRIEVNCIFLLQCSNGIFLVCLD